MPSKYRFLLINAFSLAPGSGFQLRSFTGPKETQIYNYEDLKPFLDDIDWDLHPGARAAHGVGSAGCGRQCRRSSWAVVRWPSPEPRSSQSS